MNTSTDIKLLSVLFCLCMLIAPGLNAHETSTASLKLEQSADDHLQGSWNIQYTDILRLIDIDIDGDNEVRWWEISEQRTNIEQLLKESLLFYSNKDACQLNMHLINNDPSVLGQMLSVDFTVNCNDRPITEFDYLFLFGIDPLHHCVYEISRLEAKNKENALRGVLSANSKRVSLMNVAKPKTFINHLLYGILHILLGWDHLVFIFILALSTITIGRKVTDDLESATQLLGYVSLFTLAHCITLAISAMGYFSLPSVLTETIIAFSIVWVAWKVFIEKSEPENWPVLTFGLIHGLGFGSVLNQWNQGSASTAAQLLGFNLGIELGLILILAAALYAINSACNSEAFQQSLRSVTYNILQHVDRKTNS